MGEILRKLRDLYVAFIDLKKTYDKIDGSAVLLVHEVTWICGKFLKSK